MGRPLHGDVRAQGVALEAARRYRRGRSLRPHLREELHEDANGIGARLSARPIAIFGNAVRNDIERRLQKAWSVRLDRLRESGLND